MADRDEILSYASRLLDLQSFSDYGPMGLQFPGAPVVEKIATGVSASIELFERAHEAGAQMVMVHHGIFWNNEPRLIDRRMQQRLDILHQYDLTLAGYHLALDAHPDFGNNINAAVYDLLLKNIRPFGGIGWGGDTTVDGELIWHLLMSQYPGALWYPGGPTSIKTAAVIVGGAGHFLTQAADEGYDLFLTGEPTEMAQALSRELGIHFVAAGHYNTEQSGIKRLGELCAYEFGIEHEYIDVPNAV